MEFIVGTRLGGKTSGVVNYAIKEECDILVSNESRKRYVEDLLKSKGVKLVIDHDTGLPNFVPKVFTISGMHRRRGRRKLDGSDVSLVVDDADDVLQNMLGARVEMVTFTHEGNFFTR